MSSFSLISDNNATMKVIGITGEIAAGKSLVAKTLTRLNMPLFDADRLVHEIYEKNSSVIHYIATIVPNVILKNKINRAILLRYIVDNKDFLKILEDLIHPIIKCKLIQFLQLHYRIKTQCVVLDIPLLFKIKADYLCNIVLYVNSKHHIRYSRLLRRSTDSIRLFFHPPLLYKLSKHCNFTINSGIEKTNIVYNVLNMLKLYNKISKNNISLFLFNSILIKNRVRHF